MPVKIIEPAAFCGYIRYAPSILLVAEKTTQTLKLKQILEHQGCQVCWTRSEDLGRADQAYFELIVLDLDPASETALAGYQNLKSYPELAEIPLVILIPDETLDKSLHEFKLEPVYFLPKDACTGLRLGSIIDEVHYLIHRYLV